MPCTVQWYFSNRNDCRNGNNKATVNGNENKKDVDYQNENNIKI